VLSLLTLSVCAQNSTRSGSPADLGCDEGIVKACRAAAGELVAARKLIEAQAAEIKALNDRLATEKERSRLLAEKNQILVEQNEALNAAIASQKQAAATLQKLIEEQRGRIENLEKKLAAAKRRTLLATLAGFVGGVFIRGR
jgi:predicted RNase H-like nuclease (RuvC/YqgF family)